MTEHRRKQGRTRASRRPKNRFQSSNRPWQKQFARIVMNLHGHRKTYKKCNWIASPDRIARQDLRVMRVLVRPQRGVQVLELKLLYFALKVVRANVNFSALQD